ncbi:MAG: DNA ligase [Betaproteobacteria bacterium]|nr:DNA ligase [Betaproteobacteria bacterium]
MATCLRAWLAIVALIIPLISSGAEPPAILLAETYAGSVDVSRYLVSEKLDGVRAVWDGRSLRFRSGNPIHAPGWFIDGLPKVPLDGELWIGRGQFERLSGIVRKEVPVDEEWHAVRYMIFELPDAPGTFADRVAEIRALVRRANRPWLVEIEQFRVVDRSSLQRKLREVVKAGGEGLMLHRADAPFVTGRSDVLLKLKPWHDAEATVIGHQSGKGKYAGMLGSLRVRTPDGREFALGTGLTDAQRLDPPPVGTIVTYRYRDLTGSGLPRFASFVRVRAEP